jgi:hypothetical protein
MTLLERARKLEERAQRQRTREERESIAQTLRDRTTNLERLVGRLESARERAATLREANHRASAWPAQPVAAFQAYDSKSASAWTTDAGDQAWKKFMVAFDKFVDKTETAVRQDIADAKKLALDGVSSRSLVSYEADPLTQVTARELLRRLDHLSQTKWDSVSPPELLDIIHRANALRAEVVRMQESGASTQLLEFLALLRQPDGAPFTAMTPQLRDELEARNLIGRTRLVLR